MTEYLTIVYTINDQEAFKEIRKALIGSMAASDGKPFSITACSCDHEITRIELIEEAMDARKTDLLDDIVSCRNIGDFKNINEFIRRKL